jgi:polar amino acid transport system permease protein
MTTPLVRPGSAPPLGLELRRRTRRHPGVWVANGIVVVLLLGVVSAAVTTPGFGWPIVGTYLFEIRVLQGAAISVAMTAVTMALSIVLGTGVAVLRMGKARGPAMASAAFIWVFRAVPMLVQLLFWYNLAALFPKLSIGIPFGPDLVSGNTNDLITPLSAAIIGLTLHETAYVAELVRAGLLSVPKGQAEAFAALGLTPAQGFFRITLPQALRIIVPPLGNEVISLLKATSLVSVIALSDLLYSVQLIYAKNYQTIPLLIVASLWYMVIAGLLTLAQQQLEKRLARRTPKQVKRLEVQP